MLLERFLWNRKAYESIYIVRTIEMLSNNWLTDWITRIQSLRHRHETHLRCKTSWKIKPAPIQAWHISFACYIPYCPQAKILIQFQYENQVKLLSPGRLKWRWNLVPSGLWSPPYCAWAQKNQPDCNRDSSDTHEAPPLGQVGLST